MLKELSVNTYAQYADLTKVLKDEYDKTLVLFFGSMTKSDESWCSDCTEALPLIRKAVDNLKDELKYPNSPKIVFLTAYVERNDWKGNRGYRSDKQLRLTNIPTIILWEGSTEKKRLGVDECKNSDELASVFKR